MTTCERSAVSRTRAGVSARRRSGRRGDDGTAVVEFTWLAIVLLVPLVYVVLAVMRVQAAAFAVTEAARAAGRAYATASTPASGTARARQATIAVLADQGFTLAPGSLRLSCPAGSCLTPGSLVVARVQVTVSLPLLPHVLKGATATSVPVVATHTERIDRYRSWP